MAPPCVSPSNACGFINWAAFEPPFFHPTISCRECRILPFDKVSHDSTLGGKHFNVCGSIKMRVSSRGRTGTKACQRPDNPYSDAGLGNPSCVSELLGSQHFVRSDGERCRGKRSHSATRGHAAREVSPAGTSSRLGRALPIPSPLAANRMMQRQPKGAVRSGPV